jgi:tetratricopeptide (TPR) repeat protein
MKKNLLLLNLAILCLFSLNNYAQKAKVSDEQKKSDNYAYIDAVKTYERISEKGYKSPEMLKKMGNTYYFNEELEKAAKCYGELCEMTTDIEPEVYYRYSIALKSIGENEKAIENLKKFNQLSGNQTK